MLSCTSSTNWTEENIKECPKILIIQKMDGRLNGVEHWVTYPKPKQIEFSIDSNSKTISYFDKCLGPKNLWFIKKIMIMNIYLITTNVPIIIQEHLLKNYSPNLVGRSGHRAT